MAPARSRRRTRRPRARTAASSSPAVGRRRRTSPSASSVVVVTPSRTVASYAFSVSIRWPSSRVARLDAEHQHAGRHRVERAGVADLAGAGQPAYPATRRRGRSSRRACRRRRARSAVTQRRPRVRRPPPVRVLVVELAGLLVRVGLAGVRRARAAPPRPAASDSLARASTSSRCRAFSGIASGTNVSVGACRMPSCLATSERSRPLADSSAAAVLARSASSPSTV